jgi:hypothetical protein
VSFQYLALEAYREIPDSLKRTVVPPILRNLYSGERTEATITIPVGKHLYAPVGDGDRRCRVCHNFGKNDPIHVKAVFSEEAKQDG